MSLKRLRYLSIPLIVFIILAGAAGATVAITVDKLTAKRLRHSLEWFIRKGNWRLGT